MLLKDLISDYIKNNGISYRTFAKRCGVSSAYLSMINSGNNPSTGKPPIVSMQKLAKIANGMGMSVHQLISIVDDMPIDIGAKQESSEILYISRPSGDLKADELRKYLHEVIDQLKDEDLMFMKDLSLRMVRKETV